MTERNWDDEYNALPFETRFITSMILMQHRRRDLLAERARAKKQYDETCRVIDNMLARIDKELARCSHD